MTVRLGFCGVLTGVMLLSVLFLLPMELTAAEPDPAALLGLFRDGWDETAWGPKLGPRTAYIRDPSDDDWQLRMRTLRALVAGGQHSVEPLVDVLQKGEAPERVLAAQALGYLAPFAPREALLEAAGNDEDAAVRLYAVDSLGMQGGVDLTEELGILAETEKNRDVLKHLSYALERGTEGVDPRIVRELVEWDASSMATARVGEPAPDFEMVSLGGERIRLSQYWGKSPVVLVFIYGDT